jgi:hypothetical protein
MTVAVDVTTEIVIHRAPGFVAEFAANPDNAPQWYANIKSVEWKTSPGVRIGAKAAFIAQFLGRRLAYTYEIIDFAPGERLVMRTAEGPFPMETSYSWEQASEGSTKMSLRNRGTPSGFSRIVQPLLSVAIRSANRKDLRRLKALLEG